MEISFKPVTVDDLPMLKGWMETPHWLEWWGDPEGELSDICDMIEGKDTTRPFVFKVDGKPTGYIQYWHIGHHQNPSWIFQQPWLVDLPAKAIGVDISIADADDLSKGVGTMALKRFVAALKALGYDDIIIDPDPANKRAVRSYEKAGFKPVKTYNQNTSDCLIMVHQG